MAMVPSNDQSLPKRNLKRSLHRLLTVGRVFALVAWDLEPYEPTAPPETVHWFRKFIRVLNVAYCFAIILAVATVTFLHHFSDLTNEFFPIRTLYLTEEVIVNVIVVLAMIGCKWSRSFYSAFLREILVLAKNLHPCEASIDFRPVETAADKLLVGGLLYFSIVSLIDWLYPFDQSCTFLCNTVLHILPNVIHVLALYQYAALQLIVCQCYRAINRVLARHRDQSTRRKGHYGEDLLEVLRRAHLKLGDLTGQIVDRFGPLILCTVLLSFVVLNLELFNVYKAAGTVSKRVWSVSEGFKLLNTLLWIALQVGKILLILYPAYRRRIECERTGPALYDIASQCEASETGNSALMKFAGQLLLLHGKGHPCKACGVITLDLTLISKLVAALTTYLVILIQFDSAFTKGSR